MIQPQDTTDTSGLSNFLDDEDAVARTMNQEVFIVSHKTRFPLLGPKYDMHKAALVFLQDHGISGNDAVLPEQMYFEETKEQKIERAAALVRPGGVLGFAVCSPTRFALCAVHSTPTARS